jgi:hypothetical protein
LCFCHDSRLMYASFEHAFGGWVSL